MFCSFAFAMSSNSAVKLNNANELYLHLQKPDSLIRVNYGLAPLKKVKKTSKNRFTVVEVNLREFGDLEYANSLYYIAYIRINSSKKMCLAFKTKKSFFFLRVPAKKGEEIEVEIYLYSQETKSGKSIKHIDQTASSKNKLVLLQDPRSFDVEFFGLDKNNYSLNLLRIKGCCYSQKDILFIKISIDYYGDSKHLEKLFKEGKIECKNVYINAPGILNLGKLEESTAELKPSDCENVFLKEKEQEYYFLLCPIKKDYNPQLVYKSWERYSKGLKFQTISKVK